MASFGLSTYAWAGVGGGIAGTADAAGQYIQNGTVRWEQSLFSGLTGAITTPTGMQVGTFGNAALGATSGAANTVFKNYYYGDENSVLWQSGLGAGVSALGFKAGGLIQSQYKVYPMVGTAALLQKPDMTGVITGNVTGNIFQTMPSYFDTDMSNKHLP